MWITNLQKITLTSQNMEDPIQRPSLSLGLKTPFEDPPSRPGTKTWNAGAPISKLVIMAHTIFWHLTVMIFVIKIQVRQKNIGGSQI